MLHSGEITWFVFFPEVKLKNLRENKGWVLRHERTRGIHMGCVFPGMQIYDFREKHSMSNDQTREKPMVCVLAIAVKSHRYKMDMFGENP